MDCVVAGVIVPIFILADRIPLFHCAAKIDARKAGAICERILTYARHAAVSRYNAVFTS